MSGTDAISAEAERLAKSDGYFSLMSMPAERRGLYTRAAKEVLAERERCAKIVREVGNFGDYSRAELTPDHGQPRYDMMIEIEAAILAGKPR